MCEWFLVKRATVTSGFFFFFFFSFFFFFFYACVVSRHNFVRDVSDDDVSR